MPALVADSLAPALSGYHPASRRIRHPARVYYCHVTA